MFEIELAEVSKTPTAVTPPVAVTPSGAAPVNPAAPAKKPTVAVTPPISISPPDPVISNRRICFAVSSRSSVLKNSTPALSNTFIKN